MHWLRTVKKYIRRAVSPEFTRERGAAWRPFVAECGDGELAFEPDFAVADGALGFGKVWPTTQEQRCWVHKTANILNKLPKSQ